MNKALAKSRRISGPATAKTHHHPPRFDACGTAPSTPTCSAIGRLVARGELPVRWSNLSLRQSAAQEAAQEGAHVKPRLISQRRSRIASARHESEHCKASVALGGSLSIKRLREDLFKRFDSVEAPDFFVHAVRSQ